MLDASSLIQVDGSHKDLTCRVCVAWMHKHESSKVAPAANLMDQTPKKLWGAATCERRPSNRAKTKVLGDCTNIPRIS